MTFSYPVLDLPPIVYRGSEIPSSMLATDSDRLAVEQGCYLDLALAQKRLDWLRDNFGFKPYRWQADIFRRLYGWRDATGGHRYSTASIWIPKKNGKTLFASALVLAQLFEPPNDAKLFSVAVNSKQATILLDGVIALLKASPKVQTLIKKGIVKTYRTPGRREVFNSITGSRYVALADNVEANDGLGGGTGRVVLVVDELHRLKNVAYDVVAGMTSNMPGSLEVIISTSGDGDRTRRGWQKYDYAKRVLSSEVVDPSILPVIYEYADQKTEDPEVVFSLSALLSCNPVLAEDEAKRKAAEQELIEAEELGNVAWWRRFRLNVWCQESDGQFISPDLYRASEVDPLPESELVGCPCFFGLDIGRKMDLTGITLIHELRDETLYLQQLSLMAEESLLPNSKRDDIDYAEFVSDGSLRLCDGASVGDEYLTELVFKLRKQYAIKAYSIDPHCAEYLSRKLAEAGEREIYQVKQSNNALLTTAINRYEELLVSGRIKHSRNALYEKQLSCCACITVSKDWRKLVKRGSSAIGKGGSGRIDNADSTMNALLAWWQWKLDDGGVAPSILR